MVLYFSYKWLYFFSSDYATYFRLLTQYSAEERKTMFASSGWSEDMLSRLHFNEVEMDPPLGILILFMKPEVGPNERLSLF